MKKVTFDKQSLRRKILSLGYDVLVPRSGVARVIQAYNELLQGKHIAVDASSIEPSVDGEKYFNQLRSKYLFETKCFIKNDQEKNGTIYAHHFCSDLALDYAKSKGYRTIFHCHGIRFKHFESELLGYSENPGYLSKSLLKSDIMRIKHEMDIADGYERRCFEIADIVIAPQKRTVSGYLTDVRKLHIIPSVLPPSYINDLDFIYKKKKKNTEKSKVVNIGFCGRLEYAKGFDKFLELAMFERNSAHYCFHVAGPNYWKFELNNKCNYHGWLNNRGMLNFFKILDILVVLSRYEPYGLVAIEGLLSGCKVIATKAVTSMVQLSEPPNGLMIVNDTSPKIIDASIEKLLKSKDNKKLHKLKELNCANLNSICNLLQ